MFVSFIWKILTGRLILSAFLSRMGLGVFDLLGGALASVGVIGLVEVCGSLDGIDGGATPPPPPDAASGAGCISGYVVPGRPSEPLDLRMPSSNLVSSSSFIPSSRGADGLIFTSSGGACNFMSSGISSSRGADGFISASSSGACNFISSGIPSSRGVNGSLSYPAGRAANFMPSGAPSSRGVNNRLLGSFGGTSGGFSSGVSVPIGVGDLSVGISGQPVNSMSFGRANFFPPFRSVGAADYVPVPGGYIASRTYIPSDFYPHYSSVPRPVPRGRGALNLAEFYQSPDRLNQAGLASYAQAYLSDGSAIPLEGDRAEALLSQFDSISRTV